MMACTSQTVGHLLEAVEGLNHKTIWTSLATNVSQKTRNSWKMHLFEPKLTALTSQKCWFQFSRLQSKNISKAANEVLMTKILHIPQMLFCCLKNHQQKIWDQLSKKSIQEFNHKHIPFTATTSPVSGLISLYLEPPGHHVIVSASWVMVPLR